MQSMTGFSEVSGGDGRQTWRWEARGVNGRGLDLRFRLPEGCEALEPVLRAEAGARIARGTVTVSLRIVRAPGAGAGLLDPAALATALDLLREAQEAAAAAGLAVEPPTLDRILLLPGVLAVPEAGGPLAEGRQEVFRGEIATLLARFAEARASEGAALARALAALLDQIEAGLAEARVAAESRAARAGTLLRERVAALLGAGAEAEPGRLAQELALLAVRIDVTEELDRLAAHVAAARALLVAKEPAGRKLDFLAQEFMREVNTLCSKANSAELTGIGLALKVAVDQFREQVQNVE